MKKKIIYILLLVTSLLFSSCWIYPDYKNYEKIDDTYFFEDYETMKSVIIPMINTSFKDWHWNSKEFDKKYEQYFGSVPSNEDDYKILIEKNYMYAVKNNKQLKITVDNEEKTICTGEYYRITTNDNHGVVFYQN